MDLLMLLAAFSWTDPSSWGSIALVAVGLGTVIFVHELGHFVVAKLCGVKCEKFYVGFDVPIRLGPLKLPQSLVKFKWGETEYGVGIIPLGGYVKMLGQDDNPANAQQEAERIRVKSTSDAESPDSELPSTESSAAKSVRDVAGPAAAGSPLPPAGPPPGAVALDPRSFPAKSVPRRMAIISAGVIMNLITGGIFAMVAYRMGVPYTPCQIGEVIPGGAAWRAGLQPGDKIIQIGREGHPSETLRHDKDLSESVLFAGTTRNLPVLVRRLDGTERWFDVRPMDTQFGTRRIARIGVASWLTLNVADGGPSAAVGAGQPEDAGLQPGDRILAVNGTKVENYLELRRISAAHVREPITLQVERKVRLADGKASTRTELAEVLIPPNPFKDYGMIMRFGPIEALRPGSPAEQAGFRVGDELLEVAGERVTDPMLLDARLQPHFGQEITVTVARKGEPAPVTLRVTPETPTSFLPGIHSGGINSIGISFPIFQEVKEVRPGSPAAEAGVQPGDRIDEVIYVRAKYDSSGKLESSTVLGSLELDENIPLWPNLFLEAQNVRKERYLRFVMSRSGERREITMFPVDTGEYSNVRDLDLTSVTEIHRTYDNGEAFRLGIRELKESSLKVFLFLHRLFSGEISVKLIGGPGTIAAAATAEASHGLPRLLIFLTLLSANLAVMNFLPIPVLDGGHMMFLIAEWILGRPVDEMLQYRLTLLGFACVVGLMFFAIGMDIGRFTGWWG